MRRHRHVLLPAGGDDVGVAELDVLGAQRDGAQARAADLVDAPGGAFCGQAGVDMRLAGRVLALAGGQHLAQDRLADLALVDAGPLDERFEDGGAEVVRGRVREAPLKLPTGVRAAEAMTTLVMEAPFPKVARNGPAGPRRRHVFRDKGPQPQPPTRAASGSGGLGRGLAAGPGGRPRPA